MSAFTVRATDANGQESTKQFALTVVASDFWDDMDWQQPPNQIHGNPIGNSSFDYPPTNGVFSLGVTQPMDAGWTQPEFIGVTGTQTYTGAETNVNVHIVVSVAAGILSIRVTMHRDFVALLDEFIPGAGTYDFPVTIPASVAAFINFNFNLDTDSSAVASNIQATVTLT